MNSNSNDPAPEQVQRRILLAEDDPMSRGVLAQRLRESSFTVTEAQDGLDCMEALEAVPLPDVVLLDMQMPGLHGLEVLEKIRARWGRDELPVIVVSAMKETDDVVRGLKAGANDYVAKPVQVPILLARMDVLFRLREDVQALVQAERQRVMLESLGAACHHLSQPMSVASGQLELAVLNLPEEQAELAEELKQVVGYVKEVGHILHQLQEVSEYRRVPYCDDRFIVDIDSDVEDEPVGDA